MKLESSRFFCSRASIIRPPAEVHAEECRGIRLGRRARARGALFISVSGRSRQRAFSSRAKNLTRRVLGIVHGLDRFVGDACAASPPERSAAGFKTAKPPRS